MRQFSPRQPLSIADPWHYADETGFDERARNFGGKWGHRAAWLVTIVAAGALIFAIARGLGW